MRRFFKIIEMRHIIWDTLIIEHVTAVFLLDNNFLINDKNLVSK